jgi:hypothetical protein
MRSRGDISSDRAGTKYLRVQLLARVFLSRLDRERIILSKQDTASKPIKARPGRSALSQHPNLLRGWKRPAGLLMSTVDSRRQIASGGRVLRSSVAVVASRSAAGKPEQPVVHAVGSHVGANGRLGEESEGGGGDCPPKICCPWHVLGPVSKPTWDVCGDKLTRPKATRK